jgi:hypothetical protein
MIQNQPKPLKGLKSQEVKVHFKGLGVKNNHQSN